MVIAFSFNTVHAETHQHIFFKTMLMVNEAKYMIPRDPGLRAAYRSSKFQRPKLKIHAAWAFGHVLRVAVLEERSSHGSGMVRELLSLVMEDVMVECARTGRPRPHTVVVCGDNTVKELKNSTNLLWAAQLVLHQRLRCLGSSLISTVVGKWTFDKSTLQNLWMTTAGSQHWWWCGSATLMMSSESVQSISNVFIFGLMEDLSIYLSI